MLFLTKMGKFNKNINLNELSCIIFNKIKVYYKSNELLKYMYDAVQVMFGWLYYYFISLKKNQFYITYRTHVLYSELMRQYY